PLSGAPYHLHGMEGVIPLQGSGADLISARLLEGIRDLGGVPSPLSIGTLPLPPLPEGIQDPAAFATAAVEAFVHELRSRNPQGQQALAGFVLEAWAGRWV